jgi:exodeoxyribonuclease VII small subunit
MSETPAPEIATLTFEVALAELESIVQRLERGQLDLEASIAAYERGTALRRHCAAKLEEARLRVEKITFDKSGDKSGDKNGKPRLEPADDL